MILLQILYSEDPYTLQAKTTEKFLVMTQLYQTSTLNALLQMLFMFLMIQ